MAIEIRIFLELLLLVIVVLAIVSFVKQVNKIRHPDPPGLNAPNKVDEANFQRLLEQDEQLRQIRHRNE